MILSQTLLKYFKGIQSKAVQAMAQHHAKTLYHLEDDENILRYEMIRAVWFDNESIQSTCKKHHRTRSYYYDVEKRFVQFGVIGLFDTLTHLRKRLI